MGSRWGPPDGWDELPDCATDCFRDGLSETGCEEGDERCLCEGDNWAIVGKSLDDCKDCSGSDLWRLGASYQVICDSVERESASPTPYTESSTATYATAHGGTPSSAAGAQSTTLTFIPIASHTPSQSDLDSTSLQSRNQIPKSAIIGMSVGFVVAALLIASLSIFWLRERKRRKSLEWSTESKRGSRLSLGSKRASKRSTKGESSTQVTETGIWRPSGATSTPSP